MALSKVFTLLFLATALTGQQDCRRLLVPAQLQSKKCPVAPIPSTAKAPLTRLNNVLYKLGTRLTMQLFYPARNLHGAANAGVLPHVLAMFPVHPSGSRAVLSYQRVELTWVFRGAI